MPTKDPSLEQRLVDLTQRLVNIPSDASRPEEIRNAFHFFLERFNGLSQIEIQEHQSEGNPSLVVLPVGISEPEVMFIGHLDVISYPDPAIYRAKMEKGRIVGPGAGDMKGALAILLDLFLSLHHENPGISLGMVITSDEETGGEHGIRYLFQKKGLRCGVALIPDGGSPTEVIQREKGVIHLLIRSRGQSAHAARPWLGENPIPPFLARLHQLHQSFAQFSDSHSHWVPTCAITSLVTETNTVNRIPGSVEASLDIRFPEPYSVASMLRRVKGAMGDESAYTVLVESEPCEFAPDPLFVSTLQKQLGKMPVLKGEDGGSDGRFLAPLGIPVVLTRPWVGGLHSPHEWIDILSMVKLYHTYERYIKQKVNP